MLKKNFVRIGNVTVCPRFEFYAKSIRLPVTCKRNDSANGCKPIYIKSHDSCVGEVD